MSFEIRKVESTEWIVWKSIRLEALANHPEAFSASKEAEAAAAAAAPEADFVQRLENNTVLGAWHESQLVGTVGFSAMKNPKMQHRGNMWGMYLQKEHRAKGISGALVKAVIEHARRHVLQVHCTVITSNLPAIKLYEKNGFRIYGTEPRSLQVAGVFHDEHYMVLSLD